MKCRQKLLYCKYCFKARNIANAMEHAINYTKKKNIAIGESLTLWRGRLTFRQCIPLKSSKCGIKSYELCESSSGYSWSFIIYTGKYIVFQTAFISGDTNKTAATVLSLVQPLLNKGRMLWMDNFYNLLALAQRLKSFKTVLEPCVLVGKTFHKE